MLANSSLWLTETPFLLLFTHTETEPRREIGGSKARTDSDPHLSELWSADCMMCLQDNRNSMINNNNTKTYTKLRPNLKSVPERD